jgi:hypothetical protein
MDTALADAFSNTTSKHFGLLYSDQRSQFAAAIPFIQTGLDRGERCVYIADDNTPDCVLDAMRDGGIDLDRALKSGALRVLTERDAYLAQGDFEPGRMIRFWADAAHAARRDGFTALRATGEMTWALGGAPGTDRLIEYEVRLDRALPGVAAEALCQYNQARFPDETIKGAIYTHPWIIVDGNLIDNPFYRSLDGTLPAVEPPLDRMLEALRQGRPIAAPGPATDRRLDVPAGAVIEANLHELITPFVDGELPETTAAEVARQINADAGLVRLVEAERATKQTVARLAGRHTPPPELEARIRRLTISPRDVQDR